MHCWSACVKPYRMTLCVCVCVWGGGGGRELRGGGGRRVFCGGCVRECVCLRACSPLQ